MVTETEDIGKADYALVAEQFLDEEQKDALSNFKRCPRIENGGLEMYSVFAKETCP